MTTQTYTATIAPVYSRRDKYGNCYWAFVFTDHATGQTVKARAGGGESNIRGIARHWNTPDDWDRSLFFVHPEELPIRQFNWQTADWPYAGSNPDELAQFIRDRLEVDYDN